MENLQSDSDNSAAEEPRLALARTLVQAGHMKEVQELLVPLWPKEISREETELLLRADRSLGQASRAVKLARSLKHDPDLMPYSDFWALVAIICLENDAKESGMQALEKALALDPENVALMRLKFSFG